MLLARRSRWERWQYKVDESGDLADLPGDLVKTELIFKLLSC